MHLNFLLQFLRPQFTHYLTDNILKIQFRIDELFVDADAKEFCHFLHGRLETFTEKILKQSNEHVKQFLKLKLFTQV